MLRVLPPTKKTLRPYLLQDRFERGWKNAQHRYTTRLATILQDKLPLFVTRFTEALITLGTGQ